MVQSGYRVIAYDRRGFGSSSKAVSGYDYDTLTGDLHTLMTKLDLHDATLVGFSMGGGEVARFLGKYGAKRVAKAVFMAAIPPFLLKTPDNPEGVNAGVFEDIKKAIAADRPAFISSFLSNFYNTDVLMGDETGTPAVGEKVVALGSAWHAVQLGGDGGDAVARMMGGRPVDRLTQEPAERRAVNVLEEMALAAAIPVRIRKLLLFGLVLIAAYTVPGVGVVAVWFAALFGLLGGCFLIYRAFQQRKA